ncbi:streptomycin 6-kinase [Kitasatospora nipponensis]|uniref:Streptomycin 6-kinase n=1 Tax=Kitasatospora nipponensis TaxID=258049 RepID=A0ABP4GBW5_9ACTN
MLQGADGGVAGGLFPPTLPVWAAAERSAAGRAWLAGLPELVEELRQRWSLRLGPPFPGGSCSWVAPARGPQGRPVVLKVRRPHPEAAGEAEALRCWAGRGAVRLHRCDRERYALLIERCEPGDALGSADRLRTEERLLVGAGILRELWIAPPPEPAGLERLGAVTGEWADLAQERAARLRPAFDPGLVAHGVRLLRELPASATREVVLHGDFHPGNVLAARRRDWLAIDAKPMVGDPGYDPWPLLEQLDDPFAHADPVRVLTERFALLADALDEDVRRLQAWAVARRVESALWMLEHGDSAGALETLGRVRVLAGLAGL